MKTNQVYSNFEKTQYLKNKIFDAFLDGDYPMARAFVSVMLNLAEVEKGEWNYSNLIHISHTYLGLIHLAEENIEEAKKNLLKSINFKIGSPQLKSFGPNMMLAEQLLKVGEKEVVLEYLKKSGKIWYFIFSFYRLNKWRNQIRNNEIPDFGVNQNLHLMKQENLNLERRH
ncbi:hypothetical protein [Portibacter marinus]|uniref:hypothetical protein n=1 Tax=Portibacter marinus TaxID=2898660 RepID=UPI001F2A52C8|nr:hypothetical protein [Portibacter marinus]